LKNLSIKIDYLITLCEKMDNHVINVENVYELVRLPLSYIKNQINSIFSDYNQEELPMIKQKQ
jgi:hypothetical protein